LPFAYLLILLGVAACAFAIRREVRVKPLRVWHLYGPFIAATAVAAIPFLLRPPNPGNLVVWGLALAAGAAIGVLRGLAVCLQVDQMWALVRLPNAHDALVIVVLIGLLAAARIATQAAGPSGIEYLQPLNAALAWLAGFLGGRAVAIVSRLRRAPHFELRQF
jgi:hypothetical protein